MSFFIRLDKNEFPADPRLLDGFIPLRNDYPCTLTIDYDFEKKDFTYNFSPAEHVLWDTNDTIVFTLDNRVPWMAKMRLHKHCCTDSNSPQLIRVGGQPDEVQTSKEVYTDEADTVRMKLNLTTNQMVHVGLIVQIIPLLSGIPPKFLLCDPQVGSGPP